MEVKILLHSTSSSEDEDDESDSASCWCRLKNIDTREESIKAKNFLDLKSKMAACTFQDGGVDRLSQRRSCQRLCCKDYSILSPRLKPWLIKATQRRSSILTGLTTGPVTNKATSKRRATRRFRRDTQWRIMDRRFIIRFTFLQKEQTGGGFTEQLETPLRSQKSKWLTTSTLILFLFQFYTCNFKFKSKIKSTMALC